MCSGSEAGSCFRLIDSCVTQLKAQGPSRTCTESKDEEEEEEDVDCDTLTYRAEYFAKMIFRAPLTRFWCMLRIENVKRQ